jgi:hypothetical protein
MGSLMERPHAVSEGGMRPWYIIAGMLIIGVFAPAIGLSVTDTLLLTLVAGLVGLLWLMEVRGEDDGS